MQDVYKECPKFEDDTYVLRIVSIDDVDDLLNVYGIKYHDYYVCCGS